MLSLKVDVHYWNFTKINCGLDELLTKSSAIIIDKEGGDAMNCNLNQWFHRKKGPCIKVPREIMEASKEEFQSMVVGKFIDSRVFDVEEI